MTEEEIIDALIAAGFEYELSIKKSNLKYPMTLHIHQSSKGRFNGRLVGAEGGVFSVQDANTPGSVIKAAIDAGLSLCYVIKIHP